VSVVRPERMSSAWSSDSVLLQGKLPKDTTLKDSARSMVGSTIMEMLSRYSSHVRGTTRTDVVDVEYQFHATPRKTANRNSSKHLSAIPRLDQKLWTFWAGTLVESVVQPERTSSAWSSDSMLLLGKHPTNTLKIWALSNDRIKSYGPFELVLWLCWCNTPNGLRKCGVAIPSYFKENSLQKQL
jgi:hypothetical protein